jgi:ADP-ribose pyrophosphatase YjhB (NUDIX family)
MSTPPWLAWARRLQALSQTGLHFCKDKFDLQRYEEVRDIAAEMLAAGAAYPETVHLADLFSLQVGYATPKVDVRTACFREDHILLVRELEDGCWTLPGGWADIGEAPSVAAAREVREESGYQVRITKLAALYDRDLHGHPPFAFHSYKFFFLGEVIGGAASGSMETGAAEFFPEDNLPPLSLSRVMPAQIAHLFEHYRHPELPTSFD